LDLPLVTFWMMERSIARIEAERDMRALVLSNASNTKEGIKEIQAALKEKIGTVYVPKNTLDSEGLNKLKGLASLK